MNSRERRRRDPQLHAFLVLAATTGARRAQLLGMLSPIEYELRHAAIVARTDTWSISEDEAAAVMRSVH